MPPASLLSPRHWPSWVGLGAVRLIAKLPFRALIVLGHALGALTARLPGARRRVAQRNLAVCFPELSEAERAQLLRRNLADLIEKPADDAVLLESVVDALGGREKSAVEPPPDRAAAEALSRLTPRERQVLKQLVNGATNRRIAEQLGISYRTVEVYRTRILLKTQARSFSGLIRMAVMGGLDKVNPEQQ